MNDPTPERRDLAERLLAWEAAGLEPGAGATPAMRVCEKLRLQLGKVAGDEGFRLLMARALAMAKRDTGSLAEVQVRADGALEGLARLDSGERNDTEVVLVAHLLELLVTFIGEALTLALVRDLWANVSAAPSATATREGM